MFEELIEVEGIYKVERDVVSGNIAFDLSLDAGAVTEVIKLLIDKATVPFIARYRKEKTGGLDEIQIRAIEEKLNYYVELETRKTTVLKTIHSQGCLDEELRKKIIACREKNVLEDIYLPFKPKRHTRASRAREAGLAPLAEIIEGEKALDISQDELLNEFINKKKGINIPEDALAGAAEIISEKIKENIKVREWVRGFFSRTGIISTEATKEWKGKKSKYDMYYGFREPVRDSASHRLLAIRRAAKEKVISWRIEVEEGRLERFILGLYIKDPQHVFNGTFRGAVKKAALALGISMEMELFHDRIKEAEAEAINVFSKNLRSLLLDPPAGHKVILGVDPGFRTGCKLAVVDSYGQFKEYVAIFPHEPRNMKSEAAGSITGLINKYKIDLIAAGNGTASRETTSFINAVLKKNRLENVKLVIVSEAGASVYSASETAIREFPDLDVTVRGAISIARRLQDPLSELVKIEPKSIGVGQYQHDVSQVELQRTLKGVVESCVNYVGVEVNTASRELLSYVSGIGPFLAENIVKYRQENGPFKSREDFHKISMLGDKAFEQCAGFLRIRNSSNRLDNSSIHPESYHIVEKIAADISIELDALVGNKDSVRKIKFNNYVTRDVGIPTLRDIEKELMKPGLDPRRGFENIEFRTDITSLSHLKKDMKLFGKITNVTNFGAFVDIGVHQDGLIHISNLSDKFVTDPNEIVFVGDKVRVKVLDVDTDLKRISLEKI